MALSLKVASFCIMLGLAAAWNYEKCDVVTKGSCKFMGCKEFRNADCDHSAGYLSGFCKCPPGSCTYDKESCVKENPALGSFKVGDYVEVQDQKNDVAIPGRVTNVKPLEVKPAGCAANFSWNIVSHMVAPYKGGDKVEVHSVKTDDWQTGIVTSFSNNGVLVKVVTGGVEQKSSFEFKYIRPADHKKLAAEAASSHKKAQAEFAAAVQKSDSDVINAKKQLGMDTAAATKARADLASTKKAADEAAAKQNAAETLKNDKEILKVAAISKKQEASLKEEASHGVAELLRKQQADAEGVYAKRDKDCQAKKKAAAMKKAEVEMNEKKEASGRGIAKKLRAEAEAEAKAGKQALSDAMRAAWEQSEQAVNATHQLVVELQHSLTEDERAVAVAVEANATAHKDAVSKKAVAAQATHEERQAAAVAKRAAQVANAAKKAADSAEDASSQATQGLQAAKSAAESSAKIAKGAMTNWQRAEQAVEDAIKAAEVVAGKAKCAASVSYQQMETVLTQYPEALPNYDSLSMLVIASLVFVVAGVTAAAWQSARFGRSRVIVPEDLLG